MILIGTLIPNRYTLILFINEPVATYRYTLMLLIDINKCYLSVHLNVPYRYTLMLTVDMLFFICHYKCTVLYVSQLCSALPLE